MPIKLNANPSPEWTPDERSFAILELAVRMQERFKMGTLTNSDGFDAAQRIEFLASRAPEFLESNRDAILNGQ